MRCSLVALTVLLLVTGCATEPQPQLVTDPGVSLAGYKELEVAPAVNNTGQTFDFDFVSVFTEDLKSALQAKGYHVSNVNGSTPDALIVQCTFVTYSPGNATERMVGAGTTEATVKTTVVDKKSGKAVGDMVTTKKIGGGFPLLCPACAVIVAASTIGEYKRILQGVADDVASAIDNKIKGS